MPVACVDVRNSRHAVASGAGMVVVASVVAVDPAGWYPFGPAKWTAVAVAIAATVAIAAWSGTTIALPRRVAWWWALWLGIVTVAAAFGVDRWYAWVGTPERRLGVFAWVLFAACCAIGATFDPAALVRWARFVVVAGVCCGVYALVELWFGQPIDTTAVTSRIGGPFGSAAYLGAAMCLLVPISAGVALDTGQPRWWRIAAVSSACLGVIALVGSGTRGAWIALAATAVVVAPRVPRRVVLVGIGVMLAALVVVAPRADDVVERSAPASSRLDEWQVAARVIGERPILGWGPEGYRIGFASGVDADYERTYGREITPDRAHSGPLDVAATTGVIGALVYVGLVGWFVVLAWGALRARDPVVVGVAAAFVAYQLQQLVLFQIAELDPVAWIAAGALAAHHTWCHTPSEAPAGRTESSGSCAPGARGDDVAGEGVAARSAGSSASSGDASAGFCASDARGRAHARLGDATAGFSAPDAPEARGRAHARLGDASAGFCASDARGHAHADGCSLSAEPARSSGLVLGGRRGRRVVATAAIVAATVFFVAGLLNVAADRVALDAIESSGSTALDGAQRAADLRPDVVRYHLLVAAMAQSTGSLSGIDEATHAIDRALDVSPRDPIARRAAAQVRLDRALVTGTDDDVAGALDAWRRLVADDPVCLECQLGLGRAAALANDVELARRALQEAVELSPPDDPRAADFLAGLGSLR